MKKILSCILALLLAFGVCTLCFANESSNEGEKAFSFDENGKFKILMINDTQDVGKNADERMLTFVKNAIEKTKPDLIVFDGDQLCDIYPFASKKDFAIAIDKICSICENAGVPFAVTLGNHDHDRESVMAEDEQYELYAKYSCCVNKKGYDNFTFNIPIYSSDNEKIAMNIYIMDSNNTANGSYTGVNARQVEWYKNTSDALKAQNGGEVVPSLLFQHVTVKEIYQFLKECKWNDEGAFYSRRDGKWYTGDETKILSGQALEPPCCENFDVITGQYQAWVEKGDIIGAWFAHDHLNTFEGITDDGIRMGYNGGCGFSAYGDAGNRCMRVFEIDENDITNYETYLITYNEIVEPINFVLIDLLTPMWLTWVMKAVYAVIGWAL